MSSTIVDAGRMTPELVMKLGPKASGVGASVEFTGTRSADAVLRYRFPFQSLPDLRYAKEPEIPPPVFKPPHRERFLPGTSVSDYLKLFAPYRICEVEGTMGAGKSTDMPRNLVSAYGFPVLHICPGELKALSLYWYLEKKHPDAGYVYAHGDADVIGANVTLTSGAWAFGYYLLNRHKELPFGNVVLFLDESHEDDMYTEWFRNVAVTIPGVQKVMFASGTFGAESRVPRSLKGDSETVTYEPLAPEKWDVLAGGKPWSAGNLQGNTLIFCDDHRVSARLVSDYCSYGHAAYRLHSRMDPEYFSVILSKMRDGQVVVLLADSSFRSGFTLDVDRIIDTCLVGFNCVESGVVVKKFRMAYELEHQQAAARGARTVGSKCVVYKPKVQLELAISSLTAIDQECVAVLYRLTGFKPPLRIAGVATATGPVPKDLATALNGFSPFVLLDSSATCSPVYEKPAATTDEVANVLLSYAGVEPVEKMSGLFGDLDVETKVLGTGFGSAFDAMDALGLTNAASTELVFGTMYACHGLEIGEQSLPGYGENWEAAMQALLKSEYLAMAMERKEKTKFLSSFLFQYNSSVAYLQAADAVMSHEDALRKLRSVYPGLTASWAGSVREQMVRRRGLATALIKVIALVKPPDMNVVGFEDEPMIRRIAEDMVASLRDMCAASQKAVNVRSLTDAISASVGVIAREDMKQLEPAGAKAGEVDDEMLVNIRYTVKAASGGRFDLIIFVPGAARWTIDQYVYVLGRLHEKGFLLDSVRSVRFHGSGVDSVKALAQAIAKTQAGRVKSIAF